MLCYSFCHIIVLWSCDRTGRSWSCDRTGRSCSCDLTGRSWSCDLTDALLLCSHQSGEVGMASFCRVESPASRLPSMLSALEEHDFLFQLHLNDMPQDDSNEVWRVSSFRLRSFLPCDLTWLLIDVIHNFTVEFCFHYNFFNI